MIGATTVTWAKRLVMRLDVPLLAILALALGLRLFWVLHAQTLPPATADPDWYFAVASNLAAGHGFTVAFGDDGWVSGPGGSPTTLWPPGWPVTLAASFVLFGTSLTTVKLVNAVAGVVTVYLVYRIGELSLGRAFGLLGAVFLALYPNHIFWSSTLFSDIYFTMWFAAALYLLLRTSALTGGWAVAGAAVLGLIVGFASLIRGQGVLLLPLAIIFWLMFRGRRDALIGGSVALAAVAAVVLPWTIRNVLTFDAPILISANDGYNMRIGHSPYATGRYITPTELWEMEQPGISYAEREALLSEKGRELAIEYAAGHPLQELSLSLKKLYFLVIPDSDSLEWANYAPTRVAPARVLNILSWVADGYYWTLLLLAIVGLVRSWGIRMVRFMAVALALWAAFHIVFFGEPRFHIPLLSLLVLLAAAGLRDLWGLRTAKGESSVVPVTTRGPQSGFS
jgi:4-amino-4-deoxy-L-arabinose transferase-like glycosyltransferase